MNKKNKHLLQMVIGNIIIGFGISLGVYANLGIDPGMTFFYGISKLSGYSLGLVTALCNIVFLLPMLLFDKERIGTATLFNMLCMGFIVDFFTIIVFHHTVMKTAGLNIAVMLIGIIIQSAGVVIYSNAGMGQSPLDGIPNIVANKSGRWSYRSARVVQDTMLVITGFLCGVKVGIGTLMLMLLIGPCIHLLQSFVKTS